MHPLLQPLVGEVDPPHHLEVLIHFLLENVSHQILELCIHIGSDHLVALRHHLLKLLMVDVHEAPSAQHLKHLAGHVPGDGLWLSGWGTWCYGSSQDG